MIAISGQYLPRGGPGLPSGVTGERIDRFLADSRKHLFPANPTAGDVSARMPARPLAGMDMAP